MGRTTMTREIVQWLNDLMEDERTWTFRDAALIVSATLMGGLLLAVFLGEEILKLTP
jgi:hypothetical protein